jgi:hypothetical protein
MKRWSNGAPSSGWVMWASSAAVFLCPRAAQGEGHDADAACVDPRVVVEGALDARWLEPLTRLCEQLPAIKDMDPSARLRFVAAGPDVIIEATLGEGRSALRRLRSPDDLRLTVEALTVAPPPEPEVRKLPVALAPPTTTIVAAPATSSEPARIGVEVGGALVGRVERAPTYLSTGVEAYASLRLDRYWLGLLVRWDIIEVLTRNAPPLFEMDNVGVGLSFVRRSSPASTLHLDLGATAMVLAQTQSSQIGSKELLDTELDVRLGLLARALFGRSAWRWTVAIETDVSPPRLRRSNSVAEGFPTLPTWGLGLGLGAVWGES